MRFSLCYLISQVIHHLFFVKLVALKISQFFFFKLFNLFQRNKHQNKTFRENIDEKLMLEIWQTWMHFIEIA